MLLTLFDLVCAVDLCRVVVVDLRKGLLLQCLLAMVRHVDVVDGVVVVCDGCLVLTTVVCLVLLRGVLTEVIAVDDCFDLFLEDDDVCCCLCFVVSLLTVWYW